MMSRWRRRLRYWLHRSERDSQLREEMEAHLAMKIEEFVADGMTEANARVLARRQFGNMTQKQEESRGTWIARWLNDLAQDTVFAVRTLRKEPGFAAVAIVSAALGIGACSVIFALANFALFRPLPVKEPSRLMSVSGKDVRRGRVGTSLAYPDFDDLRRASSFEGMTAFFQFMPATISSRGEPQRYWGSLVTANYFDVVRPIFSAGRGFDAARDDRKGEAPVIVLSDRLWRSRFASDRSIVGRTVELNRQKVTVVGIAGPGFQGTETMFYSDFWLPFSMADSLAEVGMGGDRLHDRGSQWLMAAGRLRDGAGQEAAALEVEVIAKRLTFSYPATNKDRSFHVERAGQANPGFRRMIVVFFALLLGVAAMVLCTACANVANLLLARASSRRKEIATRLAIGAGRGRLVRQLLTESLMLAFVGGTFGYALAHLGAASIGRVRIPLALPVDFSVPLDSRVMLFSICLSLVTAVAFGLVPALRATRPNLVGALKDEHGWLGRSRWLTLRNLLVIGQVTICMLLLISSGLFLRSLRSAQSIEIGFKHRNLLMLAFDPSLNRYTPAQTRRMVDGILETVRAIPGVESIALGSSVPLNMEGTQNGFVPTGSASGGERNPMFADVYSISPGYFDAFGIRMTDGEDFRPGIPSDDIAIANQALADRAFPKQNAVGQSILYLGRTVRIVGLVATTKSRTIGEDPHPCLYFPIAKDLRGNDSLTGMTLVVRTSGDPTSYVSPVRQTIRNVDPSLAVFDIRTMETQLTQALLLPRAAAFLFGLAGFVGLLIATVGLYGVISFAVAQRTKEIGIRMALGAKRGQVLGTVLKQGLALTVAGAAIGLGMALALSRLAMSLLYGVSPTDTATFTLVPAFLVFTALVACLVPARRAATLDPINALRHE